MKVDAPGLRGNLLLFIGNFLQNTTFFAMLLGNVSSNGFVQEYAVPQGSALNPIIFCIMIDVSLSSASIP